MLKYVPEQFKSEKMCDQAFGENPCNFTYIPDYFITEEMCRTVGKVEFDAYKKRKEQNALIREGVLPIVWHPDRVIDWCFDEEEKDYLKKLWGVPEKTTTTY